MSSDMAAILRRDADVTTTVPQPYMNALSIIRELMTGSASRILTDAEKVSETVAVLTALATVQEELDAGEDR